MTAIDPRPSPPTPPNPGWWLASDGQWYPPATESAVVPVQVVIAKLGNGLAVSALVVGIVGVLLGLIPILAVPALICGVLAFVFGLIGRSAVKKNPARPGKRMATAGVVLGIAAVILSIIGFVIVNNAVNDLHSGMRPPAIEQPAS